MQDFHAHPWDHNLTGAYDAAEQANDYEALLDYWQNYSYMRGVHFWDWLSDPGGGGPGKTDYTPQHKPAQNTLARWFRLGFQNGANPIPPSASAAAFSSSAAVNPVAVSARQTAEITATVTATGGEATGIIVDAEVYNSGAQQVAQQLFESQTFKPGQSRGYSVSFTLPANDAYKVKIGVVNYNWSHVYSWNDDAAAFGQNSRSATRPASAITIWWPKNGSILSGMQEPFKAMLSKTDVNTYNMYWQVDGGDLVLMANNDTLYPHKEFGANVSAWNWNGKGPYTVNFVAQSLSGKLLARQAVQVYLK